MNDTPTAMERVKQIVTLERVRQIVDALPEFPYGACTDREDFADAMEAVVDALGADAVNDFVEAVRDMAEDDDSESMDGPIFDVVESIEHGHFPGNLGYFYANVYSAMLIKCGPIQLNACEPDDYMDDEEDEDDDEEFDTDAENIGLLVRKLAMAGIAPNFGPGSFIDPETGIESDEIDAFERACESVGVGTTSKAVRKILTEVLSDKAEKVLNSAKAPTI